MSTTIDYLLNDNRPHYDWEGLYIHVDCEASDTPFTAENTNPLSDKNLNSEYLIHEYIHFIQNFTTTWGVPIFVNFAYSYLQIAASFASSQQDILLPLDLTEYKNKLFVEGFTTRVQVVAQLNMFNEIEHKVDGLLKPIICDFSRPQRLVLTNGLIRTEVGIKFIREHMATMGGYLFSSLDDTSIAERNKRISNDKGIDYCRAPEYWMLFAYFFQKEKIINIGKGVFLLMSYCLSTLIPTKTLKNFVFYYSKFSERYNISIDLEEFVNNYFSQSERKNQVVQDLNFVSSGIEKLLNELDQNKNNHALAEFVHKIASYSLNNISKNLGGYLTFSYKSHLEDVGFWRKLLLVFGSGVVRLRDSTIIMGNTAHQKEMNDCFMFYLAFRLVLDMIDNNKLKPCPFLNEFPLCVSNLRDSDMCHFSPFEMATQFSTDGLCLFGNAVYLLGFEKRIKSRDILNDT
ncbi:hypothetical protein [Spirosoma oryzicola]|uniref:hypothetical protein n=1 Tax=Spirosoma oryzicola TaxID=2898794 RepID=UPI001E2D58C1|nr:hypothetical protein [Spirosoma oryzicola]UHG94592.1 hypothetical protein LQ777_27975 [Spirosoma oryzicola]